MLLNCLSLCTETNQSPLYYKLLYIVTIKLSIDYVLHETFLAVLNCFIEKRILKEVTLVRYLSTY